ncbi:polysaccharide deacetylase family protein [Bacillus cereus]
MGKSIRFRIIGDYEKLQLQIHVFLEGLWIHKYPHLARKIRDEGHEIGSHAYSHLDMRGLTDDYIKWELKSTNEILLKNLKLHLSSLLLHMPHVMKE